MADPIRLTSLAHGGGCGCKLAPAVLRDILATAMRVNAERGDPARWTVPADTPQRKYETHVKEAHAARAEAMKECRSAQAGRADCVAQADALHRRDMEDARNLLRESQGGARRSR